MTGIKEAVISLAFSAISIGLCELLIPKNSFKNQMRLITGVVLFISMISPFVYGIDLADFDFSFDIDNYDYSNVSEKSVAYAAKNEIVEILEANNVTNGKITINTGLDKNKSIIIASVIILFDKKDKAISNNIQKQVSDKLKARVEIGEL